MNKIINIYDFIVTKYPIIAIKYEVCGFLCAGHWSLMLVCIMSSINWIVHNGTNFLLLLITHKIFAIVFMLFLDYIIIIFS